MLVDSRRIFPQLPPQMTRKTPRPTAVGRIGPDERKRDRTGIPYDLVFCTNETVWQPRNSGPPPCRPDGGGAVRNEVAADARRCSALVEQTVTVARRGVILLGGVGAGIVVEGQSGRACAEPASRPSAPRSEGGAPGRRGSHAHAAGPTMLPVAATSCTRHRVESPVVAGGDHHGLG